MAFVARLDIVDRWARGRKFPRVAGPERGLRTQTRCPGVALEPCRNAGAETVGGAARGPFDKRKAWTASNSPNGEVRAP